MKKTTIFLIFILTFIIGCSTNADKLEKYQGEILTIGIIGDEPEIKESKVNFNQIKFEALKNSDFESAYDAIFITKDNLREASDAEYASIYKTSKIPFYFIGNEKSHVNFIKEDLSYEDEPDVKDGAYITGLLYIKDKVWGYGLYNDNFNDVNIQAAYAKVFQDIAEIKNNELP